MTENGISRRRALAAIAGTGAAAAFGGAGTYAALSDRNTAELSLESGSIMLKIEPKEATLEPPDNYAESEGQPVEHSETWTLSNAGKINASSLYLDGISYEVSFPPVKPTTNASAAPKQSTPEEVLRAAKVTRLEYAGASIKSGDGPDSLAGLRDMLSPGHMELSGPVEDSDDADDDPDPELKAFQENERRLTIGIKFDYGEVTGNGGFTVEVEPTFSAEQ